MKTTTTGSTRQTAEQTLRVLAMIPQAYHAQGPAVVLAEMERTLRAWQADSK